MDVPKAPSGDVMVGEFARSTEAPVTGFIALESSMTPPVATGGLREAANDALEAGFLQHGFNIVPAAMPDFLGVLREDSERQ